MPSKWRRRIGAQTERRSNEPVRRRCWCLNLHLKCELRLSLYRFTAVWDIFVHVERGATSSKAGTHVRLAGYDIVERVHSFCLSNFKVNLHR